MSPRRPSLRTAFEADQALIRIGLRAIASSGASPGADFDEAMDIVAAKDRILVDVSRHLSTYERERARIEEDIRALEERLHRLEKRSKKK
jgi:hypothetical protein